MSAPDEAPRTVRVYFNGKGVDAPAAGTALDALHIADPDLARLVQDGLRALADSRGLPIGADAPVHGGAIFRVVSARGARAADGDTASDESPH